MYIQKRTVAALVRLLITVLALVGLWIEFANFGNLSPRLFVTWLLVVIALYYMVATIVAAFAHKQPSDVLPCPMLHGLCAALGVGLLVASFCGLQLTGFSGPENLLVCLVIPVLLIVDWLFLSKKGSWRAVEPFYWLALPVVYVCWVLILADVWGKNAAYAYPYWFLDFHQIGIDTMLWYLAVLMVVTLVIGYVLLALDYTLSGQLSQHIVLPRIKTIIVEEVVAEDDLATKTQLEAAAEPSKPKDSSEPERPKASKDPKALSQPSKPTPPAVKKSGKSPAEKSGAHKPGSKSQYKSKSKSHAQAAKSRSKPARQKS